MTGQAKPMVSANGHLGLTLLLSALVVWSTATLVGRVDALEARISGLEHANPTAVRVGTP